MLGLFRSLFYWVGQIFGPPLLSPPLTFPLWAHSESAKEQVQKMLRASANVVLTTGGIDDLCLKYFVEAGVIAVRRCKKEDLKRIAKATGG